MYIYIYVYIGLTSHLRLRARREIRDHPRRLLPELFLVTLEQLPQDAQHAKRHHRPGLRRGARRDVANRSKGGRLRGG